MQYCFLRPLALWKSQKNSAAPSKEATILSVKTLKEGKFPLLEMDILFENFSGYPIQRSMRFRDSKPHLNRFKKDNRVRIVLDPHKKPNPPYFLQSGKYQVSLAFILVCILFTLGYIAGCYFVMGEALSRVTSSPEQHENLFRNFSETTTTFLVLGLVLIFLNYIFKKTGLLTSKKTISQNWDLLYYGHGTIASVKSYEDTGTLINDNPMVKFIYTYLDETGNAYQGSDKKIVGKLEIVGLQDLQELEIMYLPDNPQVSKLAENLQNQILPNLARGLLLFCFFIFSVILFVSFCQDVFSQSQ